MAARNKSSIGVCIDPITAEFPLLPGDALLIDSRKDFVLLFRRALHYL
jgi:hypothetical protein